VATCHRISYSVSVSFAFRFNLANLCKWNARTCRPGRWEKAEGNFPQLSAVALLVALSLFFGYNLPQLAAPQTLNCSPRAVGKCIIRSFGGSRKNHVGWCHRMKLLLMIFMSLSSVWSLPFEIRAECFMMIERRTEKSYNGLRRMSGKRLRLEGNSLKVLD